MIGKGIPSFTVEVAGGPFPQEKETRKVCAGIKRLLCGLDMLEQKFPISKSELFAGKKTKLLSLSAPILSDYTGLFRDRKSVV